MKRQAQRGTPEESAKFQVERKKLCSAPQKAQHGKNHPADEKLASQPQQQLQRAGGDS
jgi:hypothetical protein